MNSGPILATTALRMSFGGIDALSSVDLQVSRGEILGLIGPNGSGKSTWMNCVSGVYRPTAGRVELDRADVTGLPPYRLYKRGLARTFQLLENFADLTVRENLVMSAQERTGSMTSRLFAGLDRKVPGRVVEIAEFLGIDHLLDEPVRSLSYGQQKLCDLGMALVSGPSLLLLDEPMAGVNPTLIKQISSRLTALSADGLTIVIIEHNMAVMMSLCQRIAVLNYGELIALGSPDQVRHDPAVQAAYFGS